MILQNRVMHKNCEHLRGFPARNIGKRIIADHDANFRTACRPLRDFKDLPTRFVVADQGRNDLGRKQFFDAERPDNIGQFGNMIG